MKRINDKQIIFKSVNRMIMKNPNLPDPNFLLDIHARFLNLFMVFKTTVCQECGWSVPTYHRISRIDPKVISNACREKILKIEKQCLIKIMLAAGLKFHQMLPLGDSLPSSWEENLLNKIHRRFLKISHHFKQRVCEECNFSLPTYYRIVRGQNLSRAEKEMIKNIEKESIQKLMSQAGLSQADITGEAA